MRVYDGWDCSGFRIPYSMIPFPLVAEIMEYGIWNPLQSSVINAHPQDLNLNQAKNRGLWLGPGGVWQGAPKKKKKKATYLPTYLPFLRFFEIFRSGFRKHFVVFLGSSCRETAKNAIKKIDGKRRKETSFFFSTFSAKSL
jgi:hypothetical protein